MELAWLVNGIVWTCMRVDVLEPFYSMLQCVLLLKTDLGFIGRD